MNIVEYANREYVIDDLITLELLGSALSPLETALLDYYGERKDD